MCSRKRLTFIKDFINNESVCHFMVVQLFKLSTKDILLKYMHVIAQGSSICLSAERCIGFLCHIFVMQHAKTRLFSLKRDSELFYYL